jgi:hypothetical protein
LNGFALTLEELEELYQVLKDNNFGSIRKGKTKTGY